jgi:hypothetical protein
MMTIKEALTSLNPEIGDQWTDDGLPLVELMRKLTGNDKLSRQEITDADLEFCRDKACVRNNYELQPTKGETPKVTTTKHDLDQAIQVLTEKRDALNRDIDRLQRQRDLMQEGEYRDDNEISDMQGRVNYIAKQREIRAERVTRSKSLLQGLDPKDLVPGAPIDQAMARKNTRGTVRPNMPTRLPEAPAPKE